VYVDSQPPDAALSLKEGNMVVRLGVFLRDSEIQFARNEDETFSWDAEIVNTVMPARVENFFPVHRKPIAEVDIVAVGAETLSIEGGDDNRLLPHFFEDLRVRENHECERIGMNCRVPPP
jgi:hypothetical protein